MPRRPMLRLPTSELHQADHREHDGDQHRRIGDGDAVFVVLDAADDVAGRHVVLRADQEDDGADRGHGAHEGIDERREDRRPQQRQHHLAEGLPGIGAERQRALVEAAVDLRHRGDAGPDADRHVAEDEGEHEDEAGAGELDRRHVEGDDVGDADHRAGNGEGQHGAELEGVLAGEILPHQQIGGEQADRGGQRRRDQRDLHRRPERTPGSTPPVDAELVPADGERSSRSGRR